MWIPKGVVLIRGQCLFEVRRFLEEIRNLYYQSAVYQFKYNWLTRDLHGKYILLL